MTLDEFLMARVADDEDEARRAGADAMIGTRWKHYPEDAYNELQARTLATSKRTVAECEAKRRIVEMYRGMQEWVNESYATASPATTPFEMIAENHLGVIKVLAAVYADHRDYRDEWRP